jgi:cyclic lactone autoinducer peptide
MKKDLLRAIAKLGYNSAIKAAGAASRYGTYQPKEPEILHKLRKEK